MRLSKSGSWSGCLIFLSEWRFLSSISGQNASDAFYAVSCRRYPGKGYKRARSSRKLIFPLILSMQESSSTRPQESVNPGMQYLQRTKRSSSDGSDDEDSAGFSECDECTDEDWDLPSPPPGVVLCHRLNPSVVSPVHKRNQSSMERYWAYQQVNAQQPRAKRRLESSSDRSDDEASEGSSGDALEFSSNEEDDEDSAGSSDAQESNDEDSDWTDGPSPLTMNGIVAVHCHRLTLPTGPQTGKTLAELLATLPHNQKGSMLDPIVID